MKRFVMVDTSSAVKFSMALQRNGISNQFHQNGAEASVWMWDDSEGLESVIKEKVVKRYKGKIKSVE